MTYVVSVSSRGRLTIPIQFRRELKFTVHQKLKIYERAGKLILEPIKS